MGKKNFLLVLFFLLISVCMTACSSVQSAVKSRYTEDEQASEMSSSMEQVYGDNLYTRDGDKKFFRKGAIIKITSDRIDGAFDLWSLGFSTGVIEMQYCDTKVFDSYSDTGLPPEDNLFPKYEDDATMRFLLVSFIMKNIDIDFSNRSAEEDLNISVFVPTYIGPLSDVALYEEMDEWYPDIAYFSHHGEGTKYYHFELEKGEDAEMQIGVFVPLNIVENKELALRIGAGIDRRFYFDLLNRY